MFWLATRRNGTLIYNKVKIYLYPFAKKKVKAFSPFLYKMNQGTTAHLLLSWRHFFYTLHIRVSKYRFLASVKKEFIILGRTNFSFSEGQIFSWAKGRMFASSFGSAQAKHKAKQGFLSQINRAIAYIFLEGFPVILKLQSDQESANSLIIFFFILVAGYTSSHFYKTVVMSKAKVWESFTV